MSQEVIKLMIIPAIILASIIAGAGGVLSLSREIIDSENILIHAKLFTVCYIISVLLLTTGDILGKSSADWTTYIIANSFVPMLGYASGIFGRYTITMITEDTSWLG